MGESFIRRLLLVVCLILAFFGVNSLPAPANSTDLDPANDVYVPDSRPACLTFTSADSTEFGT